MKGFLERLPAGAGVGRDWLQRRVKLGRKPVFHYYVRLVRYKLTSARTTLPAAVA